MKTSEFIWLLMSYFLWKKIGKNEEYQLTLKIISVDSKLLCFFTT